MSLEHTELPTNGVLAAPVGEAPAYSQPTAAAAERTTAVPRFRMPVLHMLLALAAVVGIIVMPLIFKGNPPYGTAPVEPRVISGFVLLGLGVLMLLAIALDHPKAPMLAGLWATFGVAATAYARSAVLHLAPAVFALALGLHAYALGSINRSWKGFWLASRRNTLTLTCIWADFGVILILGASQMGAMRQAIPLVLMTFFLTPWGARALGSMLRRLALTAMGPVDASKILYACGVLLLVCGCVLRYLRGDDLRPHLAIMDGVSWAPHDMSRWLFTTAFAMYLARHPQLDRWMRNRIFVALAVIVLLYVGLGERYAILLLLAASSVLALTVWGIRSSVIPLVALGIAGLALVLLLSQFGIDLPQERFMVAAGKAQNLELERARLSLTTAGWTGISGVHFERLSSQSITDYAVSSTALQYGRGGLLFAMLVTLAQISYLFVASSQLREIPTRLLALSLVSNIALQAVLPLLSLTTWGIPFGGVPWCTVARSGLQLVLQAAATAAITGAISSQVIEEAEA